VASIIPMPWDIDLVESQPTSCGSNDGVVYVTTTGTFNDPAYYTWNGPGASNPTQINASVWQNLAPGWYYLSIESDGCFRYDSVEVIVSNPPISQVNATPISGYAPLTVNMTNTSTNATTYVWDFGNGNSTNAADLSGQTQIYDTPGTYNIELIAINGLCSDTSTISIIVLDPPVPPVIVPVNISFPNIITANGDQVNDLFEPTLLNIISLDITILNRWGATVYCSNSLTNFWDGKSGGLMLSEGVYFYEYKAIGAQGEQFEGQGQVTLLSK
jgi:gliding motility-associated-like protein